MEVFKDLLYLRLLSKKLTDSLAVAVAANAGLLLCPLARCSPQAVERMLWQPQAWPRFSGQKLQPD